MEVQIKAGFLIMVSMLIIMLYVLIQAELQFGQTGRQVIKQEQCI